MNIYTCPICHVRYTDNEVNLYEDECPNPECEPDQEELEAA